MRNQYLNQRTDETTDRASVALGWHNAGDAVGILKPDKGTYNIVAGAKVETPAEKTARENRAHCKHIADEIDAYAAGSVYRCPECGEVLHIPDDVGDKYRCPHCGEIHESDLDALTLYDYFNDILDIDYLVNYRKEYKAAKIMVAYGGPTIYIDTEEGAVMLYWWNETARYYLSSDARAAVDEWAEEYYNL